MSHLFKILIPLRKLISFIDGNFKYYMYTSMYVCMYAGIPAPRTIGKNSRNPSGVKIKLKTFLKFWQFEVVEILHK